MSARRHVVPFTAPAPAVAAPVIGRVEARAFAEHHRPLVSVCQACRGPLEVEDDRYAGGCLDPACEAWLTPARRDDLIWRMAAVDRAPTSAIARALDVPVGVALAETVRVLLGEDGDS